MQLLGGNLQRIYCVEWFTWCKRKMKRAEKRFLFLMEKRKNYELCNYKW